SNRGEFSSSYGALGGAPAGSTDRLNASTRRVVRRRLYDGLTRASARPGELSAPRPRYPVTLGLRRSASMTSTRAPGPWARAPARFRVVVVLPSPGPALVTASTWRPDSFRSHSTLWRSVRY